MIWREPVRLEGKLEPDEENHDTCEGCYHLVEVDGMDRNEYICLLQIDTKYNYVEAFWDPRECPCGGREWEEM